MPKKSKLTFDDKLKKLKMSHESYTEISTALSAYGYSNAEIERMILKKASYSLVFEALQRFHHSLVELNYTCADIVRIVSHNGGSINLEAVKNNHETLVALGYSPAQIVRMVSHDGGSLNLEAVKNNHNTLLGFGYKPDQIVRMVSHGGGSVNLEAVKKNYNALLDLGYKSDQIVRMVSHGGGSVNLEAVINNHEALIYLGFNFDQIVKIVSHEGGSKNLTAITNNYIKLSALGFTYEQIVRMVSHGGGAKNLEAVTANYQALSALGFTSKQIITMASHNGGSKNLEAVTMNLKALLDLGFKSDQIVRMVSNNGGSKNLEAVTANYVALSKLHYTPEQIERMVSHHGGSKNLEAVTANYSALSKLKFTPEQIIQLVSQIGGSKNLIAAIEYKNYMRTFGLDIPNNKIVKAAINRGQNRKGLMLVDTGTGRPLSEEELKKCQQKEEKILYSTGKDCKEAEAVMLCDLLNWIQLNIKNPEGYDVKRLALVGIAPENVLIVFKSPFYQYHSFYYARYFSSWLKTEWNSARALGGEDYEKPELQVVYLDNQYHLIIHNPGAAVDLGVNFKEESEWLSDTHCDEISQDSINLDKIRTSTTIVDLDLINSEDDSPPNPPLLPSTQATEEEITGKLSDEFRTDPPAKRRTGANREVIKGAVNPGRNRASFLNTAKPDSPATLEVYIQSDTDCLF